MKKVEEVLNNIDKQHKAVTAKTKVLEKTVEKLENQISFLRQLAQSLAGLRNTIVSDKDNVMEDLL